MTISDDTENPSCNCSWAAVPQLRHPDLMSDECITEILLTFFRMRCSLFHSTEYKFFENGGRGKLWVQQDRAIVNQYVLCNQRESKTLESTLVPSSVLLESPDETSLGSIRRQKERQIDDSSHGSSSWEAMGTLPAQRLGR